MEGNEGKSPQPTPQFQNLKTATVAGAAVTIQTWYGWLLCHLFNLKRQKTSIICYRLFAHFMH